MKWGLCRAFCAASTVSLLLVSFTVPASAAPNLGTLVIPNVGPGYAVVSQGPLNPDAFASSSPDPAAAAGALNSLATSIDTYERVWQDAPVHNEVQDLVVRFLSTQAAQTFLTAAQHALSSGEIVSSKPLAQLPGAIRTTYFATTTQVGVGQSVTLRSGPYVMLLSTFSADAGNPQPITESDVVTLVTAQHGALEKVINVPRLPVTHQAARSSLALVALAVAAVVAALLVYGVRRRMSVLAVRREPRSAEGP